jgi:hypothetical protein
MEISDRRSFMSLYNIKFSKAMPDFAYCMIFNFLEFERYNPLFYLFDSGISAVLITSRKLDEKSVSDVSEFAYVKSIESVFDNEVLISR